MSRKPAAAAIFATTVGVEMTFMTGFLCGHTFQRVLSLTKTQEGVCLGAMCIGMSLMSAAAGHATRRWGPLPILVGGILGMMLGIAVVCVATGFYLLLLGLATIGLSSALAINGFSTLLAELFPEQVRRVMALASAIWFIPPAVASLGIGWWLEDAAERGLGAWSFRAPFLANLGLLAVCLLLVQVFVRPRVRGLAAGREQLDAPPRIIPDPGKWEWLWLPVLGACHGVMIISLRAWGNDMVLAKFGVTAVQGALVIGMVSLGLGLGRLVVAVVDFRIDDRILLAGASLAGGALIALGLVARSYVVTLIAMSVGAFISAPTFPCLLTLVGTRFAEDKSKVFGYMEASIGMSGLLGPALVGILADRGVSIWAALLISPWAAGMLGLSSLLWKLRSPCITRADAAAAPPKANNPT